MKCPKCGGERIEARHSFMIMRDATEYRLTCLDCGEVWMRKRGWRSASKQTEPKEWENVTFYEEES